MNGLFARIISRVLPRDLPTQVGRWRIQYSEVPTQVSRKGTEVKKTQSPVGRWSIETCDKKINARIDRSNEDHCGPCGRNDVNR
jgi:hypothetical protein